jgi:beta-lactamase class A
MKLRLHIDGASRGNPGPAAIGVVVQDARGRMLAEIGEYLGQTTNNVAEYRALLRGLDETAARGANEVEIFADSDLLVRQVSGEYKVRSAHLAPLHARAVQVLAGFRRWGIAHVPRERNARADALANRALDERAGSGVRNNEIRGSDVPADRARVGSQDAAPVVQIPRGMDQLATALDRVVVGLDGLAGVGVKTVWDGAERYINPDRPFPTASVFKIPVLIELLLQVEEGRLSLDERVLVTEALKSPGSGVLKELTSSPALTLADLAMLMIIISDNTATDILVERIGIDAINRRLASWGFAITRVPMDCRGLLFEIAGRPEGPFTAEARLEVEKALKARERSFAGRAYADADNDVTTPRETIALLEMLVTEGRLSSWVRERALSYLRKQQVRDRLPFHLPPAVDIAHKTGSIAGVRNDAGIIFVERGPVLVCAFTRDLRSDTDGTAVVAEVGRLVYEAFA